MLSWMVGIYYFRDYILNMSGIIKKGITSVASKNGDNQKTFRNFTPKNLNSIINYDQTVATRGKFI